jgi:hypothetical protein
MYTIDADDVFVYVGKGWEAAARISDAPWIEAPLGSSFWSAVDGLEAQLLWQKLLVRARETGRELRFRYRCDLPARRRTFEISFSAGRDDSIAFVNRFVTGAVRDPVPILDRRTPRTDGLVRMCSWCGRLAVDGAWLEVEEAVDRLGLFTADALPALTHGICDECYARIDLGAEHGATRSG